MSPKTISQEAIKISICEIKVKLTELDAKHQNMPPQYVFHFIKSKLHKKYWLCRDQNLISSAGGHWWGYISMQNFPRVLNKISPKLSRWTDGKSVTWVTASWMAGEHEKNNASSVQRRRHKNTLIRLLPHLPGDNELSKCLKRNTAMSFLTFLAISSYILMASLEDWSCIFTGKGPVVPVASTSVSYATSSPDANTTFFCGGRISTTLPWMKLSPNRGLNGSIVFLAKPAKNENIYM